MFLKTVAHSWACSKLELEATETQSLIQKLDRKKEETFERCQAKKEDYSRRIESHQKTRENELNAHIEFMTELLSIAHDGLPDLKQFQTLLMTCVDSWMDRDLAFKEIDIVYRKIKLVFSMIELLDAYRFELSKLSQRKRRDNWHEFCTAREITTASDFVEKEMQRIKRSLKSSNKEFNDELKRLESHRSTLNKQKNELYAELDKLKERKNSAVERYAANKKIVGDEFRSCGEHWERMAGKLARHVYREPKNRHAKIWVSGVSEGGILKKFVNLCSGVKKSDTLDQVLNEIKKSEDMAKREIAEARKGQERAKVEFKHIENDFDKYRHRINEAHRSGEFDTFDDDKTQKDNLYWEKQDAWDEYMEKINHADELWEARVILFDLRDELRRNIDQIRPLHPDTIVNALFEILDVGPMKVIGFATKEQKRAYWEKKQKEIENATGD